MPSSSLVAKGDSSISWRRSGTGKMTSAMSSTWQSSTPLEQAEGGARDPVRAAEIEHVHAPPEQVAQHLSAHDHAHEEGEEGEQPRPQAAVHDGLDLGRHVVVEDTRHGHGEDERRQPHELAQEPAPESPPREQRHDHDDDDGDPVHCPSMLRGVPFAPGGAPVSGPRCGYNARVRHDLMELLACPLCKGELALTVLRQEGPEILEGTLACAACDERYPIEDGIPNLLPPELREA